MGKRDADYEERLCRLNGKKPTARDRWKAFHRLWRIANGHGAEQDIAVGEAFRVLFPNWRGVRLLDSDDVGDGLTNRSHIPKFLRKQLIEGVRKRRLYAGHYEWQERDKVVANKVRQETGAEVTPLEVAEVRHKLIQKVRAKAAEKDIRVPADDEALLKWLNEGRE